DLALDRASVLGPRLLSCQRNRQNQNEKVGSHVPYSDRSCFRVAPRLCATLTEPRLSRSGPNSDCQAAVSLGCSWPAAPSGLAHLRLASIWRRRFGGRRRRFAGPTAHIRASR